MQKDIHFYLTYALAMRLGIPAAKAEKIAWADQYTDDLTEADLHGIQTQSDVAGNWDDRQVQLSVLVPFHFIPGSDAVHPWMTTRDSERARKLVDIGFKANLFQLGIALHAYQDTFSHEKFSGWREDLNSCFHWYYIKSGLPNVGHAEMRVVPDVVNYVWTDPRDGERIDNKKRAMRCAKGTYDFLKSMFDPSAAGASWSKIRPELQRLFKLDSYDKRVDGICVLSGNDKIDYAKVTKKLYKKHKRDFVKAASSHLAEAIELFSDLPWVA
jgi:hypothetical protein